MKIAGWVKSSLVDFPGKVACVLFSPGCNFDCFYCHNRSLIDGSYELLNPVVVHEFLERRRGLLDGVVLSGGEPTLQAGLPNWIAKLKSMGYAVKLDTNGASPDLIRQLLKEQACDYYAVDFKAPPLKYRDICGPLATPAAVLKTIQHLLHFQAAFEVRTTVIPEFDETDLLCMAQTLPVVPCYRLNRFRKPETFLPRDWQRVHQPPHSPAQINQFAELIRPYQPQVTT